MMGVRVYTPAMNFTSHSVGNESTPSPVVIDWSGSVDEQTGCDENIEKMIAWIKTYPRKADVHIYLGKTKQRRIGRKLQGALLAMGCKVTTRQYRTVSV